MNTQPRHHEVLKHTLRMVEEYQHSIMDRSNKSVEFFPPDQIKQLFHETGVDLELPHAQVACAEEKVVASCQTFLNLSVRTGGPRFFNQLYGRVDNAALGAECLVSAVHANVHTYEAAPVLVLIEHAVLAKVAHIFGGESWQSHDGLFVPGGSTATLYATLLARHKSNPEIRRRGMHGPPLRAFVSAEGHYSLSKACAVLGVGTDNITHVGVDEHGRMDPSALEKAIQEAVESGDVPFLVVATSGTTVAGAFDPLDQIATVCERFGVWMHVDAAWGGMVAFSETHRHLMAGVNRADSVAWCAHKMLGIPHQCSMIVTRHPNILSECNASQAGYLFHTDKNFASYDIGDKSIQCGRRGDAFKLWVLWKLVGDEGFAHCVDKCMVLAKHVENRIVASVEPNNDKRFKGHFLLVMPPSCTNVCFWYVPPALKASVGSTTNVLDLPQDVQDALGRVVVTVKDLLQQRGGPLVQFQKLRSRPNFFRLVISSGEDLETEDMDAILGWIDEVGNSLQI